MTKSWIGSIAGFLLVCGLAGCNFPPPQQPQSASGVSKATVQVQKGPDGLTTEQRNVGQRLLEDNKPGSIKHLYVISAYSGQVIIYSTVRGKVTSSGKRLSPTTIIGAAEGVWNGFLVYIGVKGYYTSEVLQDDGTYGTSGEYFYWWDTKGVYHQQYLSSGVVVHISNQPLSVNGIIINMEISHRPKEE